MTILDIAKSLLPSDIGAAALDFVLAEGGKYLDKLLNGNQLTEEEKDDFYAIIDVASRM